MNAKIRRQLVKRKRKIQARLDKTKFDMDCPVISASNIHYEIADRAQAISAGGIGAIHRMVKQLGLDTMINRYLNIFELYRDCVRCDAKCSGIVNRPNLGLTPRGFWISPRADLPLQVLVVGKNPGYASPDNPESVEAAVHRGDPNALRDSVMGFAGTLLQSEQPGFHRNLVRLLKRLLNTSDWQILETGFAISELAKCQGVDEQGVIPSSTVRACVNRWLRDEIDLLEPKMILALGREAERGLCNLLDEPWRSRVVYCFHPSWGLRNADEVCSAWRALGGAPSVSGFEEPERAPKRVCKKPRIPAIRRTTGVSAAGLRRVRSSQGLNQYSDEQVLLYLRELAETAASVKRDPVKTEFTEADRNHVIRFFRDEKSGLRLQSFVAMSRLLGILLVRESWKKLFDANLVGDLPFLIGGDPLKDKGADWKNKCFGLKEVEEGVFVVGLNRYFFDNVAGIAFELDPE